MDLNQYEVMFQQEEHHWWYLGMRRLTQALLDEWYAGPRPAEILDAGCGTGGMMAWLGQYGRVSGVDIADEALDLARSRALTRLVRGSVDALPFRSAQFDLVTSFDVLYHLRVSDDLAALAELHRVLRPGGLLLIRVPALNWLRGRHDVAVHTRHRYGKIELRSKLENAEFTVRHLTFANSLLFPLAPVKRLLEQRDRDGLSDLWRPPRAINAVLTGTLGAEAALIRRGSLPVGLSLVAVAVRDA